MKQLANSRISLILLSLLTTITVSAGSGPVQARSTLLSLYTQSDTILIGRYDKREEFGTNRVGNGFVVVGVRTSFDVSTVLKGEPRKFVIVEDEEFRYQVQKDGPAPRDAVFIDDLMLRDLDSQPKPGDTVLVFLKHEGESLILTDDRDGVRKVSAMQQSIYSDRIKELNSIFGSEKPEPTKIAEWLVRCAEQSATRWDGTHELLQGFRRAEWQKQPSADGYEKIDPTVSYKHGADAANALSNGSKAALTQILIGLSFADNGFSESSDGDRELIALVKRWEPRAAAASLLAQLKTRAYTSHENVGMMYRVAELLGDSGTTKLYRRYAELRSKGNEILNANIRPDAKLAAILNGFIATAEAELINQNDPQTN